MTMRSKILILMEEHTGKIFVRQCLQKGVNKSLLSLWILLFGHSVVVSASSLIVLHLAQSQIEHTQRSHCWEDGQNTYNYGDFFWNGFVIPLVSRFLS